MFRFSKSKSPEAPMMNGPPNQGGVVKYNMRAPSYVAYELAASGKMAHALISRGADVNTTDVHGRTPLMMAAMHAWPDTLRALLDAHASINVRDRSGHTVLDYVDPTEVQVIAILKKAGAPPSSGHSARTICDAQRALDKLGYDMP